jgi:putative transposase
MAECYMKTIKRDHGAHMSRPYREAALRSLASNIKDYNEQHSHSGLEYRSSREFRRMKSALG